MQLDSKACYKQVTHRITNKSGLSVLHKVIICIPDQPGLHPTPSDIDSFMRYTYEWDVLDASTSQTVIGKVVPFEVAKSALEYGLTPVIKYHQQWREGGLLHG